MRTSLMTANVLREKKLEFGDVSKAFRGASSLAGRVVLQMDETTPAYYGILGHLRECRQNANPDRRQYLCPGGIKKRLQLPTARACATQ